jgi:2-iminobutanoate/2-iminopropanoate deaminase
MEKKVILTKKAPSPIGPYSQAILIDGTLYCSGQIAIDASTGKQITGDVEQEMTQVMKNIGYVLEEAGMDYSDIVKTGIFLKDMNDFKKINDIYATFFTSNFPARETVEVSRLPKDASVEISVVARK